MLTFKDCLDYCGITEGEVRAIAHRERIDVMAAIAFAYHLSDLRKEDPEVRRALVDTRHDAEGSPTTYP